MMMIDQLIDRLRVTLSILAKPLDEASGRADGDAAWRVQAAQLEIVRDQLQDLQGLVERQNQQQIIMQGKV